MDFSIQLKLFGVLAGVFLLAGIGFIINPARAWQSQNQKKTLFLGIFYLIMLFLVQNYLPGFQLIAIFLVFTGFYDLIRTAPRLQHSDQGNFFVTILIIYGIITLGFINFLFQLFPVIMLTTFIVFLFDGLEILIHNGLTKMGISGIKRLKSMILALISTLTVIFILRNELDGIANVLILRALLVLIFAFLGRFFISYIKKRTQKQTLGDYIPGLGGVLDFFAGVIAAGSGTALLILFE